MRRPEPFDYIGLLLGENREALREATDRTDETTPRESATAPGQLPTEPTKPGFVSSVSTPERPSENFVPAVAPAMLPVGWVGWPDAPGREFVLDTLGRIPTVSTHSVRMVAVAVYCYGPESDPHVDFASMPLLWVLPDGEPILWDTLDDRPCTVEEFKDRLTVPPSDPGHGGIVVEIVPKDEEQGAFSRLIDRALARYAESHRRWREDRGLPEPFDLAAWMESSRRLHAVPQTDLSAIANGFTFDDPQDAAEAEARRLEKSNLL